VGSSSATKGGIVESLYAANSQITVEAMVIWAQHDQEGAQELALSG